MFQAEAELPIETVVVAEARVALQSAIDGHGVVRSYFQGFEDF